MAVVFPDSSKVPVVFSSQAEEVVYLRSKELSSDWRVYYSVTLSTKEDNEGIREGEMDFLLYHPSCGIVVMEVKGGRIRLDGQTGQFYSENRHGRSFAIKNPFQQAIVFRNRFVRYMRQLGFDAPISHAVCFPSVMEQDFSAHATIEPATLLGRKGLEKLESFLLTLVKSFHSDDFLRFKDIGSRLDDLLKGVSFKSLPMLREYLDSEELKIHASDAIHEHLAAPLINQKRLGVEGSAGTGKSMLAVHLNNYLVDQGKDVLFLVGSSLLASSLKIMLRTKTKIMTFQELAGTFGINMLIAPLGSKVMGDQWIQYEAPEQLRQKITSSDLRFDALIVDEAQDVQPFWWVAYEAFLKDKEESGLYVFFDRDQGVFGGGEGATRFQPESVIPVPDSYMKLQKNYRNTSEITQFANAFKGIGASQNASDRVGYQPELVIYESSQDAFEKLQLTIKRLISEQRVKNDEIVILSARAVESKESILHGQTQIAGLKLSRIEPSHIASGKLAGPGEIAVSTIASFKGLEAKVAIVINVCEYRMPLSNPIMSSLVYVAFTRARHMLIVLSQRGDDKSDVFQKALSTVKACGTLVVDREDMEGEFRGRVVHVDLMRFCVIDVLSQEGQGGRVLVLSTDLSDEEKKSMTLKREVKFRIRSEAGVSIATDILPL
jgi:hypothetical protein